MRNLQDRRAFLKTAGITVAAVISPRSVAYDDKPDKATQGIRENIDLMAAEHPTLVSYRKAIEAMKKLKAEDPLSWTFQANMHGAPMGDGNNAGWRWCMHGNWWFLPWHRGYVYFFERIVRKLSENDSFRLPYWAWEKAGQNVLPALFREEKCQGKANPLFDKTRSRSRQQRPASSAQ